MIIIPYNFVIFFFLLFFIVWMHGTLNKAKIDAKEIHIE
jgi:hypothetical protein